MGEFNKVTYLCGWCQKIIPLVYDDSLSYYEQLCKVREKLNEVITNTNMIPDMIKQEVQDFINSGQIEEMIGEILTGYLQRIVVNVVVPPQGITPAKGNGNDDTETFQRCIDYLAAKGGGLLFVPDGDWMVKPLTIKNGVYIAGASVSTKITLIGGSSAGLISGTVTDCGVSKLTLSNNAAQQSVDKAVIDITCNNITLDDLIVKNGYMGVNVTVNNGALIRGIRFDTLGYGGLYVNGSNADVSVSEVTVKNVSMVSGQFGVDNHCDRAVYNHIAVYGPITTGFGNTGASVTLKNAIIVGCDTGIFNVGDDCDFNALANGNTQIINDAGKRTSYNFKGQNSQRKIGENLLNMGMASPVMYRTPGNLSPYFKTIPFQDFNNVAYNVLVATDETGKIVAQPPKDYANIVDYGAVGDGTTDCTQAFKDAIATNKPVFVPAGRFLVSEPVELGSFQLLFGVGNNNLTSASNSIIISNDADTPVIRTTVGAQFTTIKNLTVTHTGTPVADGDGVLIQPGSNHTIFDVWSYNNYNGFTLQNVSLGWFTDCKAELNLNDGVHYENTSISGALQWQTQRIYAGQNKRNGFMIAGKNNAAAHVTLGAFEQVYTFSNEGYGFYILGESGGGVNGYRINNSFFGNDILGCIRISAAGTFGGFISNTVVEAAGVTDQPGLENNPNAFGIYIIEGSGPCTIENCLVHTSANTGLTSRNEFCLVNGCQFVGNGYLTENKIGATQVMGNIVFSNCYFSGQPYCGILITSAATCLLSDCMFSSDTQEVYRALAATDNITVDNLIKITQ